MQEQYSLLNIVCIWNSWVLLNSNPYTNLGGYIINCRNVTVPGILKIEKKNNIIIIIIIIIIVIRSGGPEQTPSKPPQKLH